MKQYTRKRLAMYIQEQDWTYPQVYVTLEYTFEDCKIVIRCLCTTVRTKPLHTIYPYNQYEIIIDSPFADEIRMRLLGVDSYAQTDDFENGRVVYQTTSTNEREMFEKEYSDFINTRIRIDFPYLLTMAWMV